MLEEKNDNLQEADGNLTTDSIELTQTTQQLQKRRQLLKLQHQKQLLLNWIPLFQQKKNCLLLLKLLKIKITKH
jgi:hypothetical protein